MRISIALLMLFTLLFTSCDPDVAGEKITLPPMEFVFKVSPDTAVINVGDTFSIYASMATTLSNGIKLEDGHGEIEAFIGKSNNIPANNNNDLSVALNNTDYKLIVEGGGVKFALGNPNHLIRMTSTPTGDALIMRYKFVMLKTGVFRLDINSPSFYEGSKVKPDGVSGLM